MMGPHDQFKDKSPGTESRRSHAAKFGSRRPEGYIGTNHETLGSDILSVLQIFKLPDQSLGGETVKKLEAVKPDGWYPIAWMLDLMEVIDGVGGESGLLQMGRRLFRNSHEAQARATLKSAHALVYALDDMYHFANRGTAVGGWKVVTFTPGCAELENTTPHHCMMEQGLLSEAFKVVGATSRIMQTECFRKGARLCRFVVTSAITDARWTGAEDRGKASG